jgi:hypothetical protein
MGYLQKTLPEFTADPDDQNDTYKKFPFMVGPY